MELFPSILSRCKISRVVTAIIGVNKNPVTHLFSAIYRGYIYNSIYISGSGAHLVLKERKNSASLSIAILMLWTPFDKKILDKSSCFEGIFVVGNEAFIWQTWSVLPDMLMWMSLFADMWGFVHCRNLRISNQILAGIFFLPDVS